MTQVKALVDAYDAFIRGCKSDGTWSAIKASCIMAGWDGLAGALTPLVGTAPTNVGGNFVAGDYNRKTGLVGNGSTKYLNSNLAYNSIPSNNEHLAIMRSTAISNGSNAIGGGATSPTSISRIAFISNIMRYDSQDNATLMYGAVSNTGFAGLSRSTSSEYVYRDTNTSTSVTRTSQARANTSTGYGVFAANYSDLAFAAPTSARLSFYSIGESLDLAKLDTRVTTLINAIGAAIP